MEFYPQVTADKDLGSSRRSSKLLHLLLRRGRRFGRNEPLASFCGLPNDSQSTLSGGRCSRNALHNESRPGFNPGVSDEGASARQSRALHPTSSGMAIFVGDGAFSTWERRRSRRPVDEPTAFPEGIMDPLSNSQVRPFATAIDTPTPNPVFLSHGTPQNPARRNYL
jgi:hypothetical protein